MQLTSPKPVSDWLFMTVTTVKLKLKLNVINISMSHHMYYIPVMLIVSDFFFLGIVCYCLSFGLWLSLNVCSYLMPKFGHRNMSADSHSFCFEFIKVLKVQIGSKIVLGFESNKDS